MVIIAPGMAASFLCMWSSVLIVSVFSQLKGYRTLDCGVNQAGVWKEMGVIKNFRMTGCTKNVGVNVMRFWNVTLDNRTDEGIGERRGFDS